jgi:hypothetical protein
MNARFSLENTHSQSEKEELFIRETSSKIERNQQYKNKNRENLFPLAPVKHILNSFAYGI